MTTTSTFSLTEALQDYEQRKTMAAQLTGVQTGQVRSYSFELSFLKSQGILLDLNISGTTMFERKATLDEIGAQPGDERMERMTTGRKITLPVRDEINEFKSISATLRQMLARYSMDIPGLYPYKFITFRAFQDKFKPRFLECQERWNRTIEKVVLKLDDYRDQLAKMSASEAELSWRSINGQGFEHVLVGSKVFNHDDYIDFCVERDLAQLPNEDTIRQNLHMDYVVAMMTTDVDQAAQQAQADLMRAQVAIEREHTALENSRLAEQARFEAWEHQAKQREIEDRREIIMREEMEHIRKQLQQQGSPFDRVVREMRRRAADSASEILVSIRQNGFLRGKVAEKGAGLKEYFDLMSTHDDRLLQSLLTHLEKQIGQVGERTKETPERDIQQITETLEKIEALADDAFDVLMSSDGRFAAVEL